MAHYIDKDALVAYIRSRLHPVVVPYGTNYDDWDNGADSERLNILSFLDTLEVKLVFISILKMKSRKVLQLYLDNALRFQTSIN